MPRIADLSETLLKDSVRQEGSEYQVVLLSEQDSPETVHCRYTHSEQPKIRRRTAGRMDNGPTVRLP